MEQTGLRPSLFRPTYGQATAATLVAARSLGMETILWSAWAREWTGSDAGVRDRRLVAGLGPGAIVLLHDNDAFGPPGMWRLGLDTLDALAPELQRRELTPVTLAELLGGAGRAGAAPAPPEGSPLPRRPTMVGRGR